MIEETLQEIGLSKRESLCYIALLELGSSTVGNIIDRTNIPSSKIYEVLDRLVKRGLVSYVIIGKIKHYQASHPNNILNYLDDKRGMIQGILPELILKQKFSKKQSVEMFEGNKAIFAMLNEMVSDAKKGEHYLIFSVNEENKNSVIDILFKNLSLKRKEKGVDTMMLKNIRYYNKEKHTKIRWRFTRFNLPQGTTIFRDYVVLFSWGKTPVAVRIESADFSEQFRTFFNELWKEART